MIYQNDAEFPEPMQKWACYYLSILVAMFRRFEWLGELTHKVAIEFWKAELADENKDVAADLTIEDAQNMVDDLIGTGHIKYLGKFLPGYVPKPDEIIIEKWHLDTLNKAKEPVSWDHFTLPDYDPWKGGSRTKREGKLVGLRVFKIIGG